MSTRKIIVASAAGNRAKTFTTAARTLGDLKPVIGALWNKDLEIVESRTKSILIGDDSLLPEGDCTLFLVAKKNKAGAETLTASLFELIEDVLSDEEVSSRGIKKVKTIIDNFFAGAGGLTLTAAEQSALDAAKSFRM